MSEQKIVRLVFTGGPCGGKSTALARMTDELQSLGYYVILVPEAATFWMANNVAPNEVIHNWLFQECLFTTMMHLEDEALHVAHKCIHEKIVILMDRGIPDSSVYMSPHVYDSMLREQGEDKVSVRDRRYDAVFHLRSAAVNAKDSYSKETNKFRRETAEQAEQKDHETVAAWIGHPHLRVIENYPDFEDKMKALRKEVLHFLGDPVPLEIEKKFLCGPLDFNKITVPYQVVSIEQAYLGGQGAMRVRKRGQNGTFSYSLTEKQEVRPGVRTETEKSISKDEYLTYIKFIQLGTEIVKKERVCFVYENQYFEFDIIPTKEGVINMLEIELTEENDKVSLPPFITIRQDVTVDPQYTNHQIARRIA